MRELFIAACFILIYTPTEGFQNCLCDQTYEAHSLENYEPKEGPCQRRFFQLAVKLHFSATATLATATLAPGRVFTLCCCISHLLRRESIKDYRIQWNFNNIQRWQDWDSTFRLSENKSSLFTSRTMSKDTGSYTCQLWNKGGHLVAESIFHIRVLVSEPYCGPPTNAVVEPVQYKSLLRGKATWECRSYVGEKWPGVQKFIRFFKSEEENGIPAESLSYAITKVSFRNSTLRGTLTISKILNEHLGNYYCLITNYDKTIRMNFSLARGVPDQDLHIGQLITLLKTIFIWLSAFFLVIFLVAIRRRMNLVFISLFPFKEDLSANKSYDICIIHGDDSSDWVFRVLLAFLEKEVGYCCYIPSRDMRGGEGMADTLSDVIPKCRRVIIVVSSLLLQSPWANLACHSAVGVALAKEAQVLCVLLEGFRKIRTQHQTDKRLVKNLRTLKTICHCSNNIWKNRASQVEELRNATELMQKIYEKNDLVWISIDGEVVPKDGFSTRQTTTCRQNIFQELKCWSRLMGKMCLFWKGNHVELFYHQLLLSLPPVIFRVNHL